MKSIMVMYDSLRRDLMSTYGGCISTPNFDRLAAHSVRFDRNYVGSLPCMPARRELHTGRYNFLHRSWGPVEPFDVSMPEILKKNGIHSHLATDHYHYLQDGGATYQGRYSTWACFRGQEGDEWVGDITPHADGFAPNQYHPENAAPRMQQVRRVTGWQNMANRERYTDEKDYPMRKTFDDGLEFIDRNHMYDNWFVQIETFDPHEPFTSPESFQKKFLSPDDLSSPDWPQYAKVNEDERDVSVLRGKYSALVTFCDQELGRVLDKMDEYGLWEDTLLIVCTDHGFMLSEHEWWGKGTCPQYEEISHTPFFVYDPVSKKKGITSCALTQTIDIAPTVLDHFGLEIPAEMRGHSLLDVIRNGENKREYALFGYLGSPIAVTDGRYVLIRDIQDRSVDVHEYTLMPTHMKGFFSPEELNSAVMHPGFDFTKGMPVMKIKAKINPRFLSTLENGDVLYDLAEDPGQEHPVENEAVREKLLRAIRKLFIENDAPEELYSYYNV